MAGKLIDMPIAKSSVRKRLWQKLRLGPYDGTSFRESGKKGDTIVLCLRPSVAAEFQKVTEFEGFEVEVRLTSAFQSFSNLS